MANFYTDNSDLKFQLSHPLMQKIVELKEQNFKDSGVYDYAPCNVEDAIDSYDKVMEVMGLVGQAGFTKVELIENSRCIVEAYGLGQGTRTLLQAGVERTTARAESRACRSCRNSRSGRRRFRPSSLWPIASPSPATSPLRL